MATWCFDDRKSTGHSASGGRAIQVGLTDSERGTTRGFTLSIDPGDIEVVTWDAEFAAYLGNNVGAASPLLANVARMIAAISGIVTPHVAALMRATC